MAASFSALFGTPITAAIFAMEVVSVGVMYYAAFVPCLLASLGGFLLAHDLGLHGLVGYDAGQAAVLTGLSMFQTLILGALCAVVSMVSSPSTVVFFVCVSSLLSVNIFSLL